MPALAPSGAEALHQAARHQPPAIDQHEEDQLEGQRHDVRRQHHHAERHQQAGHHHVEHEEGQEGYLRIEARLADAREALRDLERRAQEAEFAEKSARNRIDELRRNIATATTQAAQVAESLRAGELELAGLEAGTANEGLQDLLDRRTQQERALADARHELDQVAQQLRLTIETIKERQEYELINNPEYGLLSQVTPEQTIQTLRGTPTPDDLDSLITKVWKTPAFFLTNPLGVAAFGREATRRGVPPPVVSLFGAQFITWRGIPIVPSDKVAVEDGKTRFILVRTGEERQGVVGLFQPGLVGEQAPGLSVRFTGINRSAIASYLVTLYSSLAVLTDDALAVLEDVGVDHFHEYK